jgi:hypothetical protein
MAPRPTCIGLGSNDSAAERVGLMLLLTDAAKPALVFLFEDGHLCVTGI